MIEYLVFFGMLLVGLLAFIFHRKPEPVLDPITAQRIKCESPIERKLFNALVFNGYRVETQVPCGKYRIDITLPGYGIAIEADGKAYHSTEKQKAHDKKKNEYLRSRGWKVLRFSGRQITWKMGYVLQRIEKEIHSRQDI